MNSFDNATIVAVVILVGVFVLMAVTIIKSGIDAAIKLWGVMGALTGVAFGAITSFYFTDKSYQQEIQQAKSQKINAELALDNAAIKAGEANKLLIPVAKALQKESEASASSPTNNKELFSSIPAQEKTGIVAELEKVAASLRDINTLKKDLAPTNKPVEKR